MPRRSGARRYAQAVFELATSAGKIDEWRKDMDRVCRLAQDERVARAIDNPALAFSLRRKALEDLLAGRTAPPVLNLALLLALRGRFAIMPLVCDEFDALVRESRGVVGVTVITPVPLSADEPAELERAIAARTGATVEMDMAIDPSLVGGLTVRIGDLEIDASVRGRLERLRDELVQGMS